MVNGHTAIDRLRAMRPFDRLPAADLHRIEKAAELLPLRTGKALYYQGDAAEHCWLLVAGRMRGIMYRSDETAMELGRSAAGDWLGMAELILASPFLNDAIAEESCELVAFSRAAFDQLLSFTGMREYFLREMARRLYVMHSRVELATPFDRLARYLVERHDEAVREGRGSGEAVSATQEQIAEAIGASRETVNRHLGRLEADGLIKAGRGSITIVDGEALQRLCR
jgi:CRP/FNR family transcriptional regulator, cyclic AMP receptor protein